MKYLFLVVFAIVNFSSIAQNQNGPFPSPSPKGTISQVVGNTKIEIQYERPLARKRKIFGDLVPWNKLWRTGAGSSTKIRIDKPVNIEGQKIPSGYYSIFTIPNPDSWIVVLNTDTTLDGTYGYKQSNDIARFVVTPRITNRYYEALTIDIDLVQTNARLYISWANTQIDFSVITTTATVAMKFIEEQLFSGISKNSEDYFEGAQYLLYEKLHLSEALKLADKAITLDKNNGAARRVKIEIYEYMGLYNEALNEVGGALDMEKNMKYEKEEQRAAEIKYWQTHQKRIKDKQGKGE